MQKSGGAGTREKWTADEDEALIQGVESHHTSWRLICQGVLGERNGGGGSKRWKSLQKTAGGHPEHGFRLSESQKKRVIAICNDIEEAKR